MTGVVGAELAGHIMSDKQSLLKAAEALPDTASWTEITDSLLALVARRGATSDFARLYRTQITADQLAEYANPPGGVPLETVIAELEARTPGAGRP
jgi:hypothetical protein